ncbi:MAG: sugar transferase [Phycisphaerae bacterium]|jgi:exopolysaccharide biosynthesis polyprenyl glycosylphosphotransferase|nr:sugar transferase [Phycisphaerae bacterium]
MTRSIAGNMPTLDTGRWASPDIARTRRPRTEPAKSAVALPVIPQDTHVYSIVKRAADIVVAATMLVLLAPLMGVVAILVKLTSRGPVFFTQTRIGLDGRPFTMYKFRSMRQGAQNDQHFLLDLNEQDGPVFKIANDPRLTPIGKFLRNSSLDELPQFWNVLKGEMAIVGPRPLWQPEAEKASDRARLRTRVKPGLTCLWQISGRSEVAYDEWVELDLYYIQNRSLLLDLLIVVQTIPAVLSGRGAY